MTASWDKLNATDRERVQLMLVSLKEFCFRYDVADRISTEMEQGCAAMRFCMNSLCQYCCNYHVVGGGNKLMNVLKEIGSGDLLSARNALLLQVTVNDPIILTRQLHSGLDARFPEAFYATEDRDPPAR